MKKNGVTSMVIRAALLVYNLAMIAAIATMMSFNCVWNRKGWTTPRLKKKAGDLPAF